MSGPSKDRQRILVIVEDRLASRLNTALAQYRDDLQAEGYSVEVSTEVSQYFSPLQVRTRLQQAAAAQPNLEGAVLIGNISTLLFNKKKHQGDPYWHDYLSDLYYMDLDGVWEDTDGNGVHDTHRGSQTPEIWVSRLRADTLSSLDGEVALLQRYFARNHAYRTGKAAPPPPRALVVSHVFDVLRSHWGAAHVELVTPHIVAHQCRNGLAAVLQEELPKDPGYQWAIISAASGSRIHHFHPEGHQLGEKIGKWRAGRAYVQRYLDEDHAKDDVSTDDIQSLKPSALFYHLLGSQTGRHDKEDYLAGHYVFGGKGLIAIAGTQHGGSIGTPGGEFYKRLADGSSIGDAWKETLLWMEQNKQRTYTQVLCDGTYAKWTANSPPSKAVLIGDGTLRVPASSLSYKEQVALWRNEWRETYREEEKKTNHDSPLR